MSGRKGMIKFTPEEIEFCRTNFKDLTVKELAAKLNRPTGGVVNLLARLGISKKVWTPSRVSYLRSHLFKVFTIDETAQKLGLTRYQVKYKAEQLHIKKHDSVDPKDNHSSDH